MLHKYLFRKGDVSLIYDITIKEGTTIQMSIPCLIYNKVFDEFKDRSEVVQDHFGIETVFQKEISNEVVLLTFDISKNKKAISEALHNVFDWLNNDALVKDVQSEQKQFFAFTFASTSLAVTFAPWTLELFQGKESMRKIFEHAEIKMKEFYSFCLDTPERKASVEYINYGYSDEGFHFGLPGNGLWLSGKYNNEIDTHNCDHYIDQFTFFYGVLSLADEIKTKLKPSTQ